jgi:hypothetical protein
MILDRAEQSVGSFFSNAASFSRAVLASELSSELSRMRTKASASIRVTPTHVCDINNLKPGQSNTNPQHPVAGGRFRARLGRLSGDALCGLRHGSWLSAAGLTCRASEGRAQRKGPRADVPSGPFGVVETGDQYRGVSQLSAGSRQHASAAENQASVMM